MKTWNSYGSEHSANMVMIGKFKDTTAAQEASDAIDGIKEFIYNSGDVHEGASRYSDEAFKLLRSMKIHSLGPSELNQFAYDVHSELSDDRIIITTQESEISAFLKLLIDKGAKVEAFSGHDYPEDADAV
ncbi:DUF6375 family protein [Coraliomargarita sp. W4R53]